MSLDRFEQALLKSGTADRPTSARKDAARNATLRAVGISTAVAVATVTTTSTAGGVTAGAGAAASAATVKTFGIAKLVLLALLSTGAVTAVVVVTRPAGPTKDAPSAVAQSAATSMTSSLATGASQSAGNAVPVNELPSAPDPVATTMGTAIATSVAAHATATARDTTRTPTATTTPPPPASAPDPVAVEARILEAARACLAGGDLVCAHARLDEHEARFAQGALTDEALILAIDVAIADGRRDEARRIARSLLARRPNGAWSSRVKKLAGEGP